MDNIVGHWPGSNWRSGPTTQFGKRTAVKIDDTAADIWTQGKLTANNTIHIPLFLTKTNQVAGKILKAAVAIVGGSKAITQHIEGCPGCPHCMLQSSKNNIL